MAAGPFIRSDLWGEAVLTLGYSLAEWQAQSVDSVVNLGPLECLPTKIAEAQLFHVAEQHKALVLTLPMNGDPLDPQALDNFTFEVQARHKARRRRVHGPFSFGGNSAVDRPPFDHAGK